MTGIISREEYKKLIAQIKKHDDLYYKKSAPVISDYEYDLLVKEVEKIESKYPDWVEKGSPTNVVSSDSSGKFPSVKHSHPMLSLTNTYSLEEVEAYIQRMEKYTEKSNLSFHAELKMDGIALSVIYRNGVLDKAVTRGDGKKGDDVTSNAMGIKNLPKKLPSPYPKVLELRGEVFLPLAQFRLLNKQREEKGLELYANPRNAASGSLKLLDAEVSKQRGLMIVLYDVVNPIEEITKQSEISPFLTRFGLPVFSDHHFFTGSSGKDILGFANKVEAMRSDLPFEIDGIVIKIDPLGIRGEIGSTNKSPRWAIAYKFAAEQAKTYIESITVGVGRTGVLTPVANLKPVKLSGSVISRATLHNQDEIDRKDIREKDCVIIEKGGDVIPKVVKVVIDGGKKRESKWKIPSLCPFCGAEVIQYEGEVAFRCSALDQCGGQYLRKLKHFVSKGAMNIENFGVKIVDRFYELGLLETISDIYEIRREDLQGLEGFKEKSIEKLLQNIEKSKDCELYRFIFGLGIPYVGVVAAKVLAESIRNIGNLFLVTKEELLALEGIGEKLADSVISYISSEENQKEVDRFLALGVSPKEITEKMNDHIFHKKTFVITGTLEGYGRVEIKDLIEERGGKVTSAVSRVTDYLLLGKNPGSKYEKGKKLGIKMLKEGEFKNLL